MGLSRREFAKAEGCSEGAVRNALRQKRLSLRPDGTLDPSQLGRRWLRNPSASKKRAKSHVAAAQSAPVTKLPPAQIPPDVSKYYGWSDPEFDLETEEGFGILLGLKETYRTDPESIAVSMALHASAILQREAFNLGWRENSAQPAKPDDDPIGPKDVFSDFGVHLNIGLVRTLGRIVDVADDPDDEEGPHEPIDVNDPVVVAGRMIFLAVDIFIQEMKRRRREAGLVSPRDQSAAS
jgi:hypothetical protein